jgi:hypothetical protein
MDSQKFVLSQMNLVYVPSTDFFNNIIFDINLIPIPDEVIFKFT